MRASSTAKKAMSVFGVRHCRGMAWKHDGILMVAVKLFSVEARTSDYCSQTSIQGTAKMSCDIRLRKADQLRRERGEEENGSSVEHLVCELQVRNSMGSLLESLGRAPIIADSSCRITAELHMPWGVEGSSREAWG